LASIVLGIGTSHTPMLNAPAEDWPRFIERDRERGLLDSDGRPVTYATLLRGADPAVAAHLTETGFATRHERAQAALARLAGFLRAAALDALIVVGDDQDEVFHAGNLPSLLIYHGATIRNAPPRDFAGPDWARRANARHYEERAPRDYPVASELARHLIGGLIDAEFDVAAANALPPDRGEGHAFGFIHKRLMDGMPAVPIVPVFLNTYYPPNQPTPRRCYRLGQAIAAAVAAFPGDARVGVLASGGLSHFVVDETLDRAVLDALRRRDGAALQALPRHKLNSGSSEIRNWICLAGAVAHLGLEWSDYIPGYRTPAGTGTGLGFAYCA
jgi:Catalytic LigB subunit of aromatic ring-opening dioxygenase